MSKFHFSTVYDGPALADHTMDVQTLGPALLAIGDICREANRVIVGRQAEIKVNVKATSSGCFDIAFEVIQTYDALSAFLLGERATTAKTILEWLGLIGVGGGASGLGLFQFLKWKRGRKVVDEVSVSDSGDTEYHITVEGESNSVVISGPVYNLWKDPRVRSAQSKILDPLSYDGVDSFESGDGHTGVRVCKNEVARGYFKVVPDELNMETLVVSEQKLEALLLLHSPVFEEGKPWIFYYGEKTIRAEIVDPDFNDLVFRQGERFGAGDILTVDLTVSQYRTPGGRIRNSYSIGKVRRFEKL